MTTAAQIRQVVLPIIENLSKQEFSINYFAFSFPFYTDTGQMWFVTISADKKPGSGKSLFTMPGKWQFDVIYQENPRGKFIPLTLTETNEQ